MPRTDRGNTIDAGGDFAKTRGWQQCVPFRSSKRESPERQARCSFSSGRIYAPFLIRICAVQRLATRYGTPGLKRENRPGQRHRLGRLS